MHFTIISLLVIFSIFQTASLESGYFWRDLNNAIPKGSLLIGKNANNATISIGQFYVHHVGLCVGPVTSGVPIVDIYCDGLHKSNGSVQVLCTENKGKLTWVPTTSKNFKEDTANYERIVGGYSAKNDTYFYIGSTVHDGIPQVGGIEASDENNVRFSYVYEGEVYTDVEEFEVLAYID